VIILETNTRIRTSSADLPPSSPSLHIKMGRARVIRKGVEGPSLTHPLSLITSSSSVLKIDYAKLK
jgi:hypothetical protein